MTNKTGVKADITNLNKLIESLKKERVVRVGIIGNKAHKQHDADSDLTNADLGAIHEFGSEKVENHPPQRSFLWKPLKEKLDFTSPSMRDMKKQMWKSLFLDKNPNKYLMSLMTRALEVIEGAFDSNGYGEWVPLATSTETAIARKHKVMSPEDMKAYNIKFGQTKVSKHYEKSHDFWEGKLVETATGWSVTSGRQILTETGALRHSISGKIITKDK